MKIKVEVKTVWKTGLAIKILHQDKSIERGGKSEGSIGGFKASTGLLICSDVAPELIIGKGIVCIGGKSVESDTKTLFEDFKTEKGKNDVLLDILNGLQEFAENGYKLTEMITTLAFVMPKNTKASKKFKGTIKDGIYSF